MWQGLCTSQFSEEEGDDIRLRALFSVAGETRCGCGQEPPSAWGPLVLQVLAC